VVAEKVKMGKELQVLILSWGFILNAREG